MNAYKLAATLTEDGKLMLPNLPFQAGDSIEVILLVQPKPNKTAKRTRSDFPLAGTVLRYDAPFVTAVDGDYLGSVSTSMTESNSEADEAAYGNL
jgi:hypothetical protein